MDIDYDGFDPLVGSVTGPYDRSANGITKQLKWQYQAYGPKALHVMELLRPFLTPGGQKLLRYEAVLSSLEAQAK